jgi:hypothetical protein
VLISTEYFASPQKYSIQLSRPPPFHHSVIFRSRLQKDWAMYDLLPSPDRFLLPVQPGECSRGKSDRTGILFCFRRGMHEETA